MVLAIQPWLRYISQLHAWMHTATDAYLIYASKMHTVANVCLGPSSSCKQCFHLLISWTTEMCALHDNSVMVIYWLSTKNLQTTIHLAPCLQPPAEADPLHPPYGDSSIASRFLLCWSEFPWLCAILAVWQINRSDILIKHICSLVTSIVISIWDMEETSVQKHRSTAVAWEKHQQA